MPGSSPRVRGSREKFQGRRDWLGIIPAGAGLTGRTSSSGTPSRDHPRACGAHMLLNILFFAAMGSSPRMRGSRREDIKGRAAEGIIPAHAGLTLLLFINRCVPRDHPRACGAHCCMAISESMYVGSSPRMRGSRLLTMLSRFASGIIPAHAGLTSIRYGRKFTARDHPRACGAHEKIYLRFKSGKGSSPRMRGSQCGATTSLSRIGIIPAHAGLTLKNPNNDAILSVSNPIFYLVLRVIL